MGGQNVAELTLIFCVVVVVIIFAISSGANQAKEKLAIMEASNQKIEACKKDLVSAGFQIEKDAKEPSGNFYLAIDPKNKRWVLVIPNLPHPYVYKFKELISYELVDDGETTYSSNTGKALVGGLLFGAAGAVVGAASKKKVKTTCKDMHIDLNINVIKSPMQVLQIINDAEISRDSELYKQKLAFAKNVMAMLAYIKENAEPSEPEETHPEQKQLESQQRTGDIYAEIEKLHTLKEKGIITDEEFQKKKRSLLGI